MSDVCRAAFQARSHVRRTRGAALAFAVGLIAAASSLVPVAGAAQGASAAQDVGVVVNGTALILDQAPLVRDGRVFVPLRGIFERLGARVTFDAGRITATAGSHRVGLRIGESTATVDGEVQTLEAAPLVVAGRALVPLRFVSGALGAKTEYDSATHTVNVSAAPFPAGAPLAAMTPDAVPPSPTPSIGAPLTAPSAGGSPPSVPARAAIPARPGETPIVLRLMRLEPAANTTLTRRRPEISATFGESVVPASVRIAVDGEDVTAQAFVSERSFVYEPPADIAPGPHDVSVAGRTPDNETFAEHWTFTTRESVDTNYLSGLEPVSGAALGSTTFVVSGFTRPRARVRVVATTSVAGAAFADTTDASQTTDIVAGKNGYFETRLSLGDRGSGLVDVRIASKGADGNVAIRTLRLRL